jgi:SAM-dependent MidA family methyltransferase
VHPVNATEAAIRDRIAREGRITFRDFMEMALYTAPGAYYTSAGEKLGSRGDYYTSPELHPTFGALLARQLEQLWLALKRPPRFTVVEMGPGTGALARDILRYSSTRAPAFHAALDYLLVERSPDLVRRQQRTLAEAGILPLPRHVESVDLLPERSIVGCFLSNELLDAFPVHRIKVEGGQIHEVYVEELDGRLRDALGTPSTQGLSDYFRRLGFSPPDGCEAEVNLEAQAWMRLVAARLDRGAVLTIDYGYPADELYSRRHCRGTLLSFHRHTVGSDPYARVGRQDMTTHIDFTSLAATGKEEDLDTAGLTDQASFLASLGMERYLRLLGAMGLPFRDLEANRMAVRELVNPAGLGRVKVLLQHRGLPGFAPPWLDRDAAGPSLLGRDLATEPPPLRTRHHLDLTAPPDAGALLDTHGMWQELLGDDEDNE